LEEQICKEKIVKNKKLERPTGLYKKYNFKHKKLEINAFKWISTDCYKIKKKNNNSIVVLYVKNSKYIR